MQSQRTRGSCSNESEQSQGQIAMSPEKDVQQKTKVKKLKASLGGNVQPRRPLRSLSMTNLGLRRRGSVLAISGISWYWGVYG